MPGWPAAVTGVDVNVQGATATAEVVTSGTGGAWTELTGAETNMCTLANSATGVNAQSVDIYQNDGATTSDLNIGLTSGGLRLHRR